MRQRLDPDFFHPTDLTDSALSKLAIANAGGRGELTPGSRFAGYIVRECIGYGGMARVYRAEHEVLRRDVALKVLSGGTLPEAEGRARFLEEARIAAAIKHPNVVNILDVGVDGDVPFMAMELLEGRDLDAYLSSEGALSDTEIVAIALPVVAGLVAVHQAGVVHRDLKPGNIFLSRGPGERAEVVPKLLDFGISKVEGGMRITSAERSRLIGTPLYMSPEALLGEEMTALSDQYSLGVILYECATGVNPFTSDSLNESLERVTSGRFTPILERRVRPSRRLGAIIERAMSLDPAARYSDLRALGQELLSLAGRRTRLTWSLTFDPGARPVKMPLAKRARTPVLARSGMLEASAPARRWLLYALGAAGWLIAAGVATYALFGASAGSSSRAEGGAGSGSEPERARTAGPAEVQPSATKAGARPSAAAPVTTQFSLQPQRAAGPARPAQDAMLAADGLEQEKAPARPMKLADPPARPAETELRIAPEPAPRGPARRPKLGTNGAPIFD